MESKPVKCIHCGTWNLPDAKFCRSCGDNLAPYRQLQQIEEELEMREKILQEWGVSDDDTPNTQKTDNSGCASVILLFITLTGIILFII